MQKEGFTDAIIDRFFKPFLGGIFFDKELNVTSRLFEFVMRMLASGENSLPANGIGAISEQMAAALPAGSIKTGQLRLYSAWWCEKVHVQSRMELVNKMRNCPTASCPSTTRQYEKLQCMSCVTF